MRVLSFLLQKEFKQIFRNPTLLRMILAIPVIQLAILPLAADFEIKNINVVVVDHDHSTYSRDLVNKITASGYFVLVDYNNSMDKGFGYLESDVADVVLEIPPGFERNLVRENHEQLFLAINAINGTKANVGGGYLASVISSFNEEIRLEWFQKGMPAKSTVIEAQAINWFNPLLNYQFFMVPGILVVLVTMVGAYMCALNIVKEKEVGTIEQINVTPIRKHHFILGKLIPFWVIGIFVFTLGLFLVARLIYGIVPVGSLALLYGYLALYLVAVLGIGLLVSTYSQTQQQAMSLAFFLMMIFLLMSGLFTSVESMPPWARVIAQFNPVTYFIEVVRMIIMKGSGFQHVTRHFLIMAGFAAVFNTWAIINYRKHT
ncbi:ABC transporter permease [Reichenbachiella ulvae]|uniref:ABC transporter permease n=1 Tax=Reichenbachiella ulvae TaxID=2980104 RepID=A0ABT3CQT7_9BACT|nr:ABC transporter permease [Reichenbachiella ulvae]MCV9386076.1 ABC transporter permease [Reichenbachiella ulvae]